MSSLSTQRMTVAQYFAHERTALTKSEFFAGLTLPQAAECLGVSPSTADRGWRYARAWLYEAMAGEPDADPPNREKIRHWLTWSGRGCRTGW